MLKHYSIAWHHVQLLTATHLRTKATASCEMLRCASYAAAEKVLHHIAACLHPLWAEKSDAMAMLVCIAGWTLHLCDLKMKLYVHLNNAHMSCKIPERLTRWLLFVDWDQHIVALCACSTISGIQNWSSQKLVQKMSLKYVPHLSIFGVPQNVQKSIRADFLGVPNGVLKMVPRPGIHKVRFCYYLLHFS